MQSVASLESIITEVIMHGPGIHLGSSLAVESARKELEPHIESLKKKKPVTKRFNRVLRLLGKQQFNGGTILWTNTKLLIGLRNYLVHYRSELGKKMDEDDFIEELKQLGHTPPVWVARARGHMNFFPHHCLSAECAAWAVRTAVAFLDGFYDRLGIASPLDGYRPQLALNGATGQPPVVSPPAPRS
jgi:hypothetical protein